MKFDQIFHMDSGMHMKELWRSSRRVLDEVRIDVLNQYEHLIINWAIFEMQLRGYSRIWMAALQDFPQLETVQTYALELFDVILIKKSMHIANPGSLYALLTYWIR